MSRPRSFRRLGSAALLGSLILGAVGTPGVAAAKTLWVDDDGKAGPAGCNAAGKAPKKVQAAVKKAATDDIIRVCPGTYTGRVTISGSKAGLQLVSVKPRKAILRAPAPKGLSGTTSIVTIQGVNRVTVRGFAVRTLRFPDCDAITGIGASGAKKLTIVNNDLRSINPDTTRSCLFSGVRAINGSTGTVTGNTIRDYLDDGIYLEDNGTNVLVKGNTIRFVHLPYDTAAGAAVQVRDQAVGRIRDNSIISTATPPTASGVHLRQAKVKSLVRGNTITGATVGIRLTQVSGLLVKENTVTGGEFGILMADADGMTVHDNTATGASLYGIFVSEFSSGNDLRRNEAFSDGEDCRDESGPPIENLWLNNDGDTDFPVGICTDLPS